MDAARPTFNCDKEVTMAESNGDYATVIGADASLQGTLKFDKGLRLLGKFDGQIESAGSLLVAEGATLSGEVRTGSIRIDGSMNGNLDASDKVHLSSTARLEGDLRTARLEVADGAVFAGHVAVGPQASKAKSNGAAQPGAQPNPQANRQEKGKPAAVGAGKG